MFSHFLSLKTVLCHFYVELEFFNKGHDEYFEEVFNEAFLVNDLEGTHWSTNTKSANGTGRHETPSVENHCCVKSVLLLNSDS